MIAKERQAWEARQAKEKSDCESLAQRISALRFVAPRKVGENEQLFGSVTAGDVAEFLKGKGIEIDKRKVQLDEAIKHLGEHEVKVKLHPEVQATLRCWSPRKARRPALSTQARPDGRDPPAQPRGGAHRAGRGARGQLGLQLRGRDPLARGLLPRGPPPHLRRHGRARRAQPADRPRHAEGRARPPSALEAVGGAAYLAALIDGVPRITSVEHWSRIIKEKAVLRNLIHAGNRIVHSCYEGEDEAAVLLDQAEKSIFDIAERRIRAGFVEHARDRQGELPHHRPALPVEGRGHRARHRLRRHRRDDERAAEGRPRHRGRPPRDGQDLLLPQHRAARGDARGGDGGPLLARDVEGAARAAAAVRRRARSTRTGCARAS